MSASNSTPSTATVTTAVTPVLASNVRRKGATVYNDGAADACVAWHVTVSTTAFGVRMVPGAYFEMPFDWRGPVTACTAAGTTTLRVIEMVA